jgi:hypothetical protein
MLQLVWSLMIFLCWLVSFGILSRLRRSCDQKERMSVTASYFLGKGTPQRPTAFTSADFWEWIDAWSSVTVATVKLQAFSGYVWRNRATTYTVRAVSMSIHVGRPRNEDPVNFQHVVSVCSKSEDGAVPFSVKRNMYRSVEVNYACLRLRVHILKRLDGALQLAAESRLDFWMMNSKHVKWNCCGVLLGMFQYLLEGPEGNHTSIPIARLRCKIWTPGRKVDQSLRRYAWFAYSLSSSTDAKKRKLVGSRGPGFDSRALQKSSGSGKGSIQPREYNWGATW